MKLESWVCDKCLKNIEVDKSTFDFDKCDKPGCIVLHTPSEPVVKGVEIKISFITEYAGKASETRHLCKECYEISRY